MKKAFSIALISLSVITYAVLCIYNFPRAESVSALFVLLLMALPTLPVIVLTEAYQLKRPDSKAERTGLVFAVLGTLAVFAFWFFMVLVGGDKQKTAAISLVGINVVATFLLWLKVRLYSEQR